MAAVAGNLRLTFSDTALEHRRSQLVRASSTGRKTEPARTRQSVDPEENKRRGQEHVGMHEVASPTTTTGSATPPGTQTSTRSNPAATERRALATGAADRYITEREQKRVNGFDIPKHARYTSLNAGAAAYAGTRWIDGHALALLRQGDAVMVLEIDEATSRRLRHLPLGAQVGVNAKGAIKSKGRSR